MKRFFYFLALIGVVGSLVVSCNNGYKPKGIKRVVVIGFDGMSVGGVMKAHTPNFDEYNANGAYSFHCRNIFPTVSSPNWAAMLTGSNATQTGVTSNGWQVDDYQLPPVLTTENGRYPDIFYVLKKNKPSLKTASVYDWGDFGRLYDNQFVDVDIHPEGALKTAETASTVIKEEKPDFLFIHFDHVDHAGHADGHMTPAYLKAVELADSLAAVVVNATKEAGTYDETLFIITADHGGVGHGHGDMTIQGNEVPFFLFGNHTKSGYELPVEVNLMDLAATVAYAFDVPRPQAWVGRPVVCALKDAPEPDPATLVGIFLSAYKNTPVILPQDADGKSGGLYVGEKALVTIQSEGKDGKIRYTTDRSIPTENSTVYTEPFELAKSGVIRAAYFGNDGSHSTYSEAFYRVVEKVNENTGVNYKIYQGEDLGKIPAFSFLKKVSSGRAFEISTDQIADELGENIAVEFDGYITIEKPGKYEFFTASDDGSKLFLDGKELVNNDGDHGTKEESGSVQLEAGKHKIKVDYFNGGGGGYLTTSFRGPGIPKQILSPEFLSVK